MFSGYQSLFVVCGKFLITVDETSIDELFSPVIFDAFVEINVFTFFISVGMNPLVATGFRNRLKVVNRHASKGGIDDDPTILLFESLTKKIARLSFIFDT